MSYFSSEYRTYLKSGLWQVRRLSALDRAGHRCQVCAGTKRLQVHHVTYKNLGREKDNDLTVLCWECHFVFTWYKRVKRFIQWLFGVKRWTTAK
jgi:5-methylcytosine-specific restriction endonuclease McrA